MPNVLPTWTLTKSGIWHWCNWQHGGLQNRRCWFESNMLCSAYPQVVGKVFGVVLWRL